MAVSDSNADDVGAETLSNTDSSVYGFLGVPNFRDAIENKIADEKRRFRPGMLFRCATLEEATATDVKHIVEKLDIQTIVDLRSRGESRAMHAAQDALEGVPKVADQYELMPDPPIPAALIGERKRKRFTIDYISRLRRFIWKSLDIFTKISFLILSLFCLNNWARRLVIQNSALSRDGLFGLNKAILDHCGSDIKLVMDILSKEENYPVLIHCTAGKDRTGLTIALVQSLLGIPKDQIVQDYVKSEECLQSHMGRMVVEMGKHGMSEEFLHSPPQVMERTLDYIEAGYGTVENYLESVGVRLDQQEKIRRLLQQP